MFIVGRTGTLQAFLTLTEQFCTLTVYFHELRFRVGGGGMKDSWGHQVQRGGDRDYLATLNTAQPCGVEGKGMCEEPRFHDNQMPTPYFGGKKGEGPYVSLEDFPLKRLQVVVNRVRPGHGERGAVAESLGEEGSPLTSWPCGLCD